MIEAYPLHWPEGWPKTEQWKRESSKFKSTVAVARDELFAEIGRLRGRYFCGPEPILSTNIELRQDGIPHANRRNPDDPGVAVYFEYKKQGYCFACDKYKRVWENMVAIRKTIEAIRGIERWGASDMMQRAFSGFVQIEDQSQRTWWQVLGVSEDADNEDVSRAYRALRSKHHPDRGGDQASFQAVMNAWNEYISK